MNDMYTLNVGDLINMLSGIDENCKVYIKTNDDIEHEITMVYFKKNTNNVFLSGDQRLDQSWWLD
jgi:hypothetical protein